MSIGRIELSRIPITFAIFVVIMSFAAPFVEGMFPGLHVTDYYYSIHVTDGALSYFEGLAREGGVIGTVGTIMWGGLLALRGLLMILESLVLGGYPVWKMLGLDVTLSNGFNIAVMMSVIMEVSLGFTLFRALSGGLRA